MNKSLAAGLAAVLLVSGCSMTSRYPFERPPADCPPCPLAAPAAPSTLQHWLSVLETEGVVPLVAILRDPAHNNARVSGVLIRAWDDTLTEYPSPAGATTDSRGEVRLSVPTLRMAKWEVYGGDPPAGDGMWYVVGGPGTPILPLHSGMGLSATLFLPVAPSVEAPPQPARQPPGPQE